MPTNPDHKVLTGNSILTFQPSATINDFEAFLADYEASKGVSVNDWWSDLFKIGFVPATPDSIDPLLLCRHHVEDLAAERALTPPIVTMPALLDHPATNHLGLIGATSPKTLGALAGGRGVNVAILDSGFASGHPDFPASRFGPSKAFVGKSTDDENGHGTHCTGLACGPRVLPNGNPGYGVADQSTIMVIRISDASRATSDFIIIKGLEFAGLNQADIALLAYNAGSADNEPPFAYERAARVLLERGCLVISSAGDNAFLGVGPVEEPANCNSIVAIGSVDSNLRPSSFSPGLVPAGDPIDFVAPGENVLSAAVKGGPIPASGTSVSAAIAAGIAALWVEKTHKTGADLWQLLIDNAKEIPNARFARVGSGLLVAP